MVRTIAARFGVTTKQMLDANPGVDPERIFPGQELEVPSGGTPADSTATKDAEGFAGTYSVRSGDTLGAIAKHFGVSLKRLRANNAQIEDANLIRPGDVINVPGSGGLAKKKKITQTTAPGMPAWLAIAKREMDTGVDEVKGAADNARIVEYHHTTTLHADDDETPWCSSFVNWCVEQAGLRGTDSAWARSWNTWGDKISQPKKGCIVVFKRPPNPNSGHVAFYWGKDGNRLLVLGGNQGNQVNIRGYPKDRLLSYRWPKGQ
jgi:uncharacterized protein (TIGR02594 family)